MADWSSEALLAVFVAAAIVTFLAGVQLAKATDVLDDRYGLGEAIGGMILLSVAGSLPELAITASAATSGHLDIAAGNLIGGVAMQTFVLVIADRFVRGPRPLSAAAASLVPALEGMLVVGVVCITIMSAVLPETAAVGPVGAGTIFIVAFWCGGMYVLNKVRDRSDLALVERAVAGGAAGAVAADDPTLDGVGEGASPSTGSARAAIVTFALASVVTLFAGVMLEQSGNGLADNWGMNGVLFGATFLAAATALPEISTGITGVRLRRYTLVFGDMFGGNAFQLTLFLVADILAGEPALPFEGASNAWIGGTGLVMTAIFVFGIILRPARRHWGLGLDSWLVTLAYVLGLWGLVVVSS